MCYAHQEMALCQLIICGGISPQMDPAGSIPVCHSLLQLYLYFLDIETGYHNGNGERKGLSLQKYQLGVLQRSDWIVNTTPGVDSFVQQELTKNWAPAGFRSLSTNLFDV